MLDMRRGPVVVAGVVAVMAMVSAGCELAVNTWSAEVKEAWSRDYALTANGSFELTNTNGAITVEPSPDTQVHVKAEKVAKGATDDAAREALKRIEIVERVDKDSVRLETRTAPSAGLTSGGSLHVRYTIQVPATVSVKVENTNGHVKLVDLQAAVAAETTNGGIEGRGLKGSVRAGTTNGGIDMDVAAVHEGGVELSTTNGGIDLKLPAAARADISASCTNGGIDAGGLSIDTIESTRRRLEGRMNGGGPKVRAETTNGGIHFGSR